jgi:hypothetical protein
MFFYFIALGKGIEKYGVGIGGRGFGAEVVCFVFFS